MAAYTCKKGRLYKYNYEREKWMVTTRKCKKTAEGFLYEKLLYDAS